MASHDLLPCPFCGARPCRYRPAQAIVHPDSGCILDGFEFPLGKWNTRAAETEPLDAVAERIGRAVAEHSGRGFDSLWCDPKFREQMMVCARAAGSHSAVETVLREALKEWMRLDDRMRAGESVEGSAFDNVRKMTDAALSNTGGGG